MIQRDKNVMVTGCSSGIGRCVALGLRDRGYRVFATARTPHDLEQLTCEGLHAVALHLDDPDSVRAAVSLTEQEVPDHLDLGGDHAMTSAT